MKKIVINDNYLNDYDIEKKVVRVKGLVFNSNGKILMAYNNNTFQFPGGHLEKDEIMEDCIKREIKEETGIDVNVEELPFLCISTYDNNYFGSSKKVLNNIYYYKIYTDLLPDFTKTHYDQLELQSEFSLYYVPFDTFDEFLQKNMEIGKIDLSIGREMLLVYNECKDLMEG